jgi:hypothetical protein
MMKKIEHIHVLLMPLFPFLYLLAQNYNEYDLFNISILTVVLIITAISASLFLIIIPLLHNRNVSAISVSIFMIWFFSYGYYYHLVYGVSIGNCIIGRSRYILPFYFVLLAAIMWVVLYNKKNSKLINYLSTSFNFAAIFLSLISVNTISSKKISQQFNKLELTAKLHNQLIQQGVLPDTAQGNNLQDIYYIILDSYPSNIVLKKYYHFDNNIFLQALRERGFYVADKSTSNYPITQLSLCSSLNMCYPDDLPIKKKNNKTYISSLNNLVDDNEVMRLAKKRGFQIVKIGSYWQPTSRKETKSHLTINEVTVAFLKTSLLKEFFDKYYINPSIRVAIMNAFERLQSTPSKTEFPKFVFAHILCPHPPYVFGPDGEQPKTSLLVSRQFNNTKLFTNQVNYLNQIVLKTVDTILAQSHSKPIIILQGDHGYWNAPWLDTDAMPDGVFLNAQFHILNAYLVPENVRKHLYPEITPVNSFRIIFKVILGIEKDVLQDKNYYASHIKAFKHIEVTPIIHADQNNTR